MSLQILYPNGQVMACQMYVWDVNTLSPVLWDGEVTFSGTISVGAVDQGAAGLSPWLMHFDNTSLAVTGPLTDTELRASAVPVSGTFFQATQPVSVTSLPLPSGAATEATLSALNAKVTAVNTDAVVVSSSALPTNAAQETGGNLATLAAKDFATSAKQDTGNTSLSSIDTKLTSQATASKQDTGNTSLSSIDGKLSGSLTVQATNLDIRDLVFATDKVDVSGSSVVVTNAGTFAVQDAATEASLVAINTDTDTLIATGAPSKALTNDVEPEYTADDYQPLSMNYQGRLRIISKTEEQQNAWKRTSVFSLNSDPFSSASVWSR